MLRALGREAEAGVMEREAYHKAQHAAAVVATAQRFPALGETVRLVKRSCPLPSPWRSPRFSTLHPKGRRALLRIPSTEGRSVCLCWEHLKLKGPKGPKEPKGVRARS